MCFDEYDNSPLGSFPFSLLMKPFPESVTALSLLVDSYVRQNYLIYYGNIEANMDQSKNNNLMIYMDQQGLMNDGRIIKWFNETIIHLIHLKRLCRIKFKLQYTLTGDVVTAYIFEE
jgi:hypothetical protein